MLYQKKTEKPGGELLGRQRIHNRVLCWGQVTGLLWKMEVAEFGQFSLLEEGVKHFERQAGQRGQSILAPLKVKGGMGRQVH